MNNNNNVMYEKSMEFINSIITIGTGALGGAIDDTTQGVGTADSFTLARILASMIQTGLVDGTVGIGPASGLTVTSDTCLTVGTLLVTQTR